MDIDQNKKRKFDEIDRIFPKSEILKELTLEEQQKYIRLDNYLVGVTKEELTDIYFSLDKIQAFFEPYDRMLFKIFMKKIFNQN